MKPHVLRARQGRSYWWIVADWTGVLISRAGESLASTLRRWEALHGKAKEGFSRVLGVSNLVEAGQRIGVYWREHGPTATAKGGAK